MENRSYLCNVFDIIKLIFVLSILGGIIISNNKLCKGKHFIIEYGLDQNHTLKEIVERLKKDQTTISSKIKRNKFLRVIKKKGTDFQSCQHWRSCVKTNLCSSTCGKQFKKCTFINCYRICNEYWTKKCSKINLHPYVCTNVA